MELQNGLNNMGLEQILSPYNPWWKNGDFKTEDFRRPVFHKIYKDLFSLKQIISITGPRRVGKTTLLKQIIKTLISDKKINPEQIIYFSFDDPVMVDVKINNKFFNDLVKWSERKFKYGTVYFFFDEIQRFANWELYLKKYYDLGLNCRFVISGSASSPIFKKSRESLLGRIKDYHVLPFSFSEFAYFTKREDKKFIGYLDECQSIGQKLQEDLIANWISKSPELLNIPRDVFNKLNKILNLYFIEGGFPEVWEIEDIVSKQEYLFNNQIQKVIFEDLVIATEFRKPENIKRFYLSLIEQPGQEVSVEKASMKIGVSRIMLEKYLPLLEMTDLVKSVPKFSQRPLKFRRGSIKCYLVDLALRNAVLKLGDKILEDKAMLGFYAENLVFNALRNLSGTVELSFYKDKGEEIDFIVSSGQKQHLPVEVKYRETINEPNQIRSFIKKYNQKFGIVVTKGFETNQHDNDIAFIPLSIFLALF